MHVRPHLLIERLEPRRLFDAGLTAEQIIQMFWDSDVVCWNQLDVQAPSRYLHRLDGHVKGLLATFAGSLPPDDYIVLIDWGETVIDLTWGDVRAMPDGRYGIFAEHQYADSGDYGGLYIGISVVGADATLGTDIINTFVLTGPMRAHPRRDELLVNDGDDILKLGDLYDLEPAAASDYTIAIDWGDGTVSSGVVYVSDYDRSILGRHVYARPGSYEVNFTVTRPRREQIETVSGQTAVEVLAEPRPPETVPMQPIVWPGMWEEPVEVPISRGPFLDDVPRPEARPKQSIGAHPPPSALTILSARSSSLFQSDDERDADADADEQDELALV